MRLTPLEGVKNDQVAGIIEAIDKAREDFHVRTRDVRVGFGVMCVVQAELRRRGYKGLEWGDGDVDVDVMLGLLRGRLGRDVRQLGTIVKWVFVLVFFLWGLRC
jgi:hypothetical protein